MSKKMRYLLLAFGFLLFLVVAPLIVMYVLGIKYDYTAKTFIKTGILSINTDPSNSDIYLNNKLAKTSDGNLHFLTPGDYDLKVSHPGFSDWTKHITIKPGQVTWIGNGVAKIPLFIQNPPAKTLGLNTADFTLDGNNLIQLTDSHLVISPIDDPTNSQNFQLPGLVDKIIASDQNGHIFIAGQTQIYLFSQNDKKFTDLSQYLSPDDAVQFSGGKLLILENGALFSFDYSSFKKTALASNVQTFATLQNSLYFISNTATSGSLSVMDLADGQAQALSTIPVFQKIQILPTAQKNIFLLADGSLYQVNSQLDDLADGVTAFGFDQQSSDLILAYQNQLAYYDFTAQTLQFITRSGGSLTSPLLKTNLGYAFFYQNNTLTALELDTSGQQNQYTFYTANNAGKLMMDSAGRNIFLMDGAELKEITIR